MIKNSANLKKKPDEAVTPPIESGGDGRKLSVVYTGSWQVTIYEHYAKLEALWRRMEIEGRCTAFQTFDWAACWYDTAISCGEAEPLIVVVSKDDGEPVWILPLCLYRKKNLRLISFADLGVSDYTAPVMAPGAPLDKASIEAIIKAVLQALPPCDIVEFQKIAVIIEDIPNPLLHLHGIQRFPVDCHGIRFEELWSALFEKIVPADIRSNIRRRTKLLKKEGELVFNTYNSPETVRPLMNRLIAMRDERFASIGKPEMPALWRNFYQMLASRQGRSIDITITTMSVADAMIAASFGVARKNTFHGLLAAFEMGKWQRFSPGILLCHTLLSSFSEQANGSGYFDFSVGDEPYKKCFGSQSYPLYEWMLPRTGAGLVHYLAWRFKIILRRYPRALEIMKKIKGKARA